MRAMDNQLSIQDISGWWRGTINRELRFTILIRNEGTYHLNDIENNVEFEGTITLEYLEERNECLINLENYGEVILTIIQEDGFVLEMGGETVNYFEHRN